MNPPQPNSAPLEYAGGDRLAVDTEHLNLLSIFHYIVGGLLILMSCMFLAVVVMGMDILQTADINPASGWIYIIIGSAGLILGWLLSCLIMLVGYYIAQRRHRKLTLVVAAINILLFPFGTLLGVCTFVVLGRNSIRLLYADGKKNS